MKKFLALLLCLMTVISMTSITAFAESWEWDFSYDVPGQHIEDMSPKFLPIDGAFEGWHSPPDALITAEDQDGNTVAKFLHPARAGNGYAMMFRCLRSGDTVATFGTSFVIQYDLYLDPAGETANPDMILWFDSCKTADGSWIIGGRVATDGLYFAGDGTILGNIEFRKWVNIATAYDFVNQTYSVYLDGELVGENIPTGVTDTEISYHNISFGDHYDEEAVAYVDNLRAYSGSSPDDYEGETTESDATEPESSDTADDTTTVGSLTGDGTTDPVTDKADGTTDDTAEEPAGAPVGLIVGIVAAVVVVAVVVVVVLKKKKA